VKAIGSDQAKAIERDIAAVEAATGAQVVAAFVPRADDYPEAPWRAFALAAALAALIVWAVDVGRPDWVTPAALLAQALAILGAGGLGAIAARYVPAIRRAFVRAGRMQGEVRQCAEVMFLARELFATPNRNAVLILVAELERRVVIVPDVAYRGRVSTAEWQAIVDRMTPHLAAGSVREAFATGLAALQALLVPKGFAAGDGINRLPDRFVRGEAP
jgi:uncharacterized membrane protein